MRQDALVPEDGRVYTPEIKAGVRTTRKYMLDNLVMLAAPVVMAWYYYGGGVLRHILLTVLTAVLCEYIGERIVGTVPTVLDLSAVVTGVVTALCLPASSPLWFGPLAVSFAILVVKVPFGHARSLLFSPAAAGLAFVTVCLPQYMFAYPALPHAGEAVALYGTSAFSVGTSLTKMLSESTSMGSSLVNYIDVLMGSFPGPAGTGCVIALLGALLYLAVRRPKSFTAAGACLAVAAIMAFLFPRILTGRFQSVFMELSGGMLFFTALFLLPEEAILPKHFYGRLLYGATAGLFCMLFRLLGEFEEGAVFAVLLVNVLSAVFDKMPLTARERRKLSEERRDRREELAKAIEAQEGGDAHAEMER